MESQLLTGTVDCRDDKMLHDECRLGCGEMFPPIEGREGIDWRCCRTGSFSYLCELIHVLAWRHEDVDG
jgi:hypothetical protein